MMNRRYTKIYVIAIAIFFGFFILSNTAHAGLVPCGTSENPAPCTKCHIFQLLKNIIDYMAFTLAPIVGTVLITIGGLIMIIGGAKPDMFGRGKGILTNTLIGIAIIYASWMLANTVLKSLAGDSDVAKKWYQVECSETIISQAVDDKCRQCGDGATNLCDKNECAELGEECVFIDVIFFDECISSDFTKACVDDSGKYSCASEGVGDFDCSSASGCRGDDCVTVKKDLCGQPVESVELANNEVIGWSNAVLESDITLSTAADCPGFHARGNIEDMAKGLLPFVCDVESGACNCQRGGPSGKEYVEPRILESLFLLQGWSNREGLGGFTISSLMTGVHSPGSAHYAGRAVDIVPHSDDPEVWNRFREFIKSNFGGSAVCEAGDPQLSCDKASSHIHWQI